VGPRAYIHRDLRLPTALRLDVAAD